MPDYRCYRIPGGTCFFTVNLLERHPNDLLIRQIDVLRQAVKETRKRWPFYIDSWVVLTDHLHGIWTLPQSEDDNSNRWRVIKQTFSKALPMIERHSAGRVARGELVIWRRRFWEHIIVDDADYAAHVNYCPINPQKHGLVKRVADWPYSTFHRDVAKGLYSIDWATSIPLLDVEGERRGTHAAQYGYRLLRPMDCALPSSDLSLPKGEPRFDVIGRRISGNGLTINNGYWCGLSTKLRIYRLSSFGISPPFGTSHLILANGGPFGWLDIPALLMRSVARLIQPWPGRIQVRLQLMPVIERERFTELIAHALKQSAASTPC